MGNSTSCCGSPGRPKRERAPRQRRKRRARSKARREVHASATGLPPIRTRVSTAGGTDTGGTLSPLTPTVSVFSEDEWHDAHDQLDSAPGSFSSGASPRAFPAADDDTTTSGSISEASLESNPGLLERLASLLPFGSASGPRRGGSLDGGGGGGGGSRARSATASPPPGANPDEVLEPGGPDHRSSMGCLPLFTAAQAVRVHQRFLRAVKPPAGASFRNISGSQAASLPAEAAAEPAAPPPIPRLTLLPRLLRVLSPSPSRKTEEEAPGGTSCAWEPADATTFMVRGRDYMCSKQKEMSGPGLYRLLGVDMYSFDCKLYHIAQHIQLPEAPKLGAGALALPPDQRLPPLLVLNLQLPTYPPSLFGGNDGPGHSLIYYFALPEGWEPSQVENKTALALVQRFVHNRREMDGQPSRDRLKLLGRIVNVEEWAQKGPLSGYEHRLLQNYNEKPLLTRPQHRFYTGAHYLEIDVDVHNYAYIARKAFYGFVGRLAPVVFENAFVVQGNRPEELPELVLAAVRVYRVDFTHSRPFPAKSLADLGNGVGPAHDGTAEPAPASGK